MLRRAESEEVEGLAADVDEALHVADEAAAADAAEAKVSVSGEVERCFESEISLKSTENGFNSAISYFVTHGRAFDESKRVSS